MQRTMSNAWPRANGQVERVNRVIKAALRKYISAKASPTAWAVYLPEMAMSLRFLVTKSHGLSPYLVVFK